MSTPLLSLNNGVEIPALGFGVFQTPPDETIAAVEAALAVGYRHIDTAAAYGNEREVGEALRRFLGSSGLDRSEVFVETKVWISDYGYDETLHAFDKSAGKLGVDQDRPVHPAPGAAGRIRPDHRRLPGAGEAAGRRQGPGDRGQQLHARPPRRVAGRDLGGAGGQPDRGASLLPPVGPARRRRRARDPFAGVVADRRDHVLPRQVARQHDGGRHDQADRGGPRQDAGSGDAALAPAAGSTGHPEVRDSVTDRENFDVFDFELTTEQLDAIDALDTGVRGGPEPDVITRESFGRPIPEA